MVTAKKHHELYKELATIVGAKYVSDDYAVLLSYTRDMSTVPAGKPQGVAVRPGSVEEVVELVVCWLHFVVKRNGAAGRFETEEFYLFNAGLGGVSN